MRRYVLYSVAVACGAAALILAASPQSAALPAKMTVASSPARPASGTLDSQRDLRMARTAAVTRAVVAAPREPRRLIAFEWAVRHARGCPYSWGGSGPCGYPGYDCSGLVQAAWQAAGITLPRTTEEMQADTRQLVRISASQARRGDIILWFSDGSAFHTELVAYRTTWAFGAHDQSSPSGFDRTWDVYHQFYRVR